MEDLTEVVEKIAEKLGMAADKLQPLGETLVEETANSCLFKGVVTACVTVLFIPIFLWIYNKTNLIKDKDDRPWAKGTLMVVFIVCMILGITGIAIHFAEYLSPTKTLIKELLQ